MNYEKYNCVTLSDKFLNWIEIVKKKMSVIKYVYIVTVLDEDIEEQRVFASFLDADRVFQKFITDYGCSNVSMTSRIIE